MEPPSERRRCWRVVNLDGLCQAMVAIFIFWSTKNSGSVALKLRQLNVPDYAITGETATLECNYDLGREALYVVKWFKDTEEFYRYMPGIAKATQTFNLPGVQVDVASSNDKRVVLRNISLKSAGKYRCEVSADAPSFHTIRESAPMRVYDLPDSDPVLSGTGAGGMRYTISKYEWIIFNCTSHGSYPAANLTWQVNGKPVDSTMSVSDFPIVQEKTGTFTTIKQLKFSAQPQHVKDGEIKIKCISRISAPGSANLYYKSQVKTLLAPSELKRSNAVLNDGYLNGSSAPPRGIIAWITLAAIAITFRGPPIRH